MQRHYMVKHLLRPVAACRPSPHIYTDMQPPTVAFLLSITGITLGGFGAAGLSTRYGNEGWSKRAGPVDSGVRFNVFVHSKTLPHLEFLLYLYHKRMK